MTRSARVVRTVERAREELTASIETPELQEASVLLRRDDSRPTETILDQHLAGAGELSPIIALLAKHPALAGNDEIPLERFLLAETARAALDRIASLPVVDSVRQLLLDEICLYASPDVRRRPMLHSDTESFRAACEVVRLRRFPAGQYHWDVSGFSRRHLRHVSIHDLPGFLLFLTRRMKGRGPAFFPHVNGFRRNPYVWLETESNRSLHRMAACLDLQPAIVGLVTRAWLHDPRLGETSPHLAWVNTVFLENGGLVVANGPAGTDAGFLANNAARQKSFEDGSYQPQYGIVLWPRTAMLEWAARHPEFSD